MPAIEQIIFDKSILRIQQKTTGNVMITGLKSLQNVKSNLLTTTLNNIPIKETHIGIILL